jgi:hypothetical protein
MKSLVLLALVNTVISVLTFLLSSAKKLGEKVSYDYRIQKRIENIAQN